VRGWHRSPRSIRNLFNVTTAVLRCNKTKWRLVRKDNSPLLSGSPPTRTGNTSRSPRKIRHFLSFPRLAVSVGRATFPAFQARIALLYAAACEQASHVPW
jgi:hypothetical protein